MRLYTAYSTQADSIKVWLGDVPVRAGVGGRW
jgi:hypothetical protein